MSAIIDISGEIDLGLIKIILGELEEDDELDNYENWTGQGLSNMIHNYLENNHPGQGKGLDKNNPGKGNKNNPGKGN